MTSIPWQAFGSFGLACAAAGFLLALGTVALIDHRRETREFDAEIEAHEQRIAANRAPRHAKSQPRAGERPPLPGAVPSRPRPQPTYARGANGQWFRDVPARPAQRLVTTAGDLSPVFMPRPGVRVPVTPQRAPSKHGADDTGRLPRVKLATADTGEIRAVGDQLVRAIESGAL